MKSKFLKVIAAVVLALVMMFLPIASVHADDIEFVVSLSQSRRLNYVGEEVEFTVKVINTDIKMMDELRIYNIGGRTAIATHGSINPGEIVYVAVPKVFDTAGSHSVKFEVKGIRDGVWETVITNTITVTVNEPPAPTPSERATSEPSPTATPTPEPTSAPTEEPTTKPTPAPAAAATPEPAPAEDAATETAPESKDEDTPGPADEPQPASTPEEQAAALAASEPDDRSGGETQQAQAQAAGTETEQNKTSQTWLYIVIAAAGAALVAAAAITTNWMRKKKRHD